MDLVALRSFRLARLTDQMARTGVDLLVLVNPVSPRYAAQGREYAIFVSRIRTYYLFIFPDGKLVMHGAYATANPTIDEFRPANFLSVFDAGLELAAVAEGFAREVEAAAGSGARVAIERVSPSAVQAREVRGLQMVDGVPLIEQARSVKSPEELMCMRHSIATAEAPPGRRVHCPPLCVCSPRGRNDRRVSQDLLPPGLGSPRLRRSHPAQHGVLHREQRSGWAGSQARRHVPRHRHWSERLSTYPFEDWV